MQVSDKLIQNKKNFACTFTLQIVQIETAN